MDRQVRWRRPDRRGGLQGPAVRRIQAGWRGLGHRPRPVRRARRPANTSIGSGPTRTGCPGRRPGGPDRCRWHAHRRLPHPRPRLGPQDRREQEEQQALRHVGLPGAVSPRLQGATARGLGRPCGHQRERPGYPVLMDMDAYQAHAVRSAAEVEDERIVSALGLCGESGEYADLIKKSYAQGHPWNQDAAIEEVGDILWYVAYAAYALGVTLSEVAARNEAKLSRRYPDGFRAELSILRWTA